MPDGDTTGCGGRYNAGKAGYCAVPPAVSGLLLNYCFETIAILKWL